jgi:hypothetical protein
VARLHPAAGVGQAGTHEGQLTDADMVCCCLLKVPCQMCVTADQP